MRTSLKMLHVICDLEKACENLGEIFLGNKINPLKDFIVVKSLPYLVTERRSLSLEHSK